MLKFPWQKWTELIPVSSSIVKTICRIHGYQDLSVTTPQDLISVQQTAEYLLRTP